VPRKKKGGYGEFMMNVKENKRKKQQRKQRRRRGEECWRQRDRCVIFYLF
jgi:hypothetical protein